jgi:hypothetical protein
MLFVSEGLWNVLNSPLGDTEWEFRVAQLRATLERFVDGSTIDPKYLFLLHPLRDGVWEIRCTRPDPSIRVMGLFVQRDVFVATHHEFRSELGEFESKAWKDAKLRAKAEWRNLFHTYAPMKNTKVVELVSGAIDGKYFK